jgi:hypothetical protein
MLQNKNDLFLAYLWAMKKKSKSIRRAIRERKYEQKIATNANFQDMLKADAANAEKIAKRKAKEAK